MKLLTVLAAAILLAGCATIVPQTPADAVLRIVDVIIYRGQ